MAEYDPRQLAEFRQRAEEAVAKYVTAQGWPWPRISDLPELLREVPDALWSETVRDLIAVVVERSRAVGLIFRSAVEPEYLSTRLRTAQRKVRNLLVASGRSATDEAKWEEALQELLSAAEVDRPMPLPNLDSRLSDISGVVGPSLPRILRNLERPSEALSVLAEVVRFMEDVQRGEPVRALDDLAKCEASRTGRSLDGARAALAEKLGVFPEALRKARQRERKRRS